MLDKSLQLCYLLMTKDDMKIYPRYDLPDGYYFTNYKAGDEVEWAKVEISVGQFNSIEEGVDCFNIQFSDPNCKKEDRIIFVHEPSGKIVATGAMWTGEFKGKTVQRMHWIAVDESCKGKGIAKSIVTKLLDVYNDLNLSELCYLVTESWCYSAVNIYLKFGFKPYFGDVPTEELGLSNEEFVKQNEQGWRLVNQKINIYSK